MDSAAAELQRRHAELEGKPDPFPSLKEIDEPAQVSNVRSDPDSVEAFPSLSSSNTTQANQPATVGWSASRIKAAVPKQPTHLESFTLPSPDLSTAGKDGKPISLGEIMKQVMSQFKVKIEASTNQKLRQTTFFIRAEREKDLEKAKNQLLHNLSPKITVTMHAPVSTIPSIIGSKGANLKALRDKTGVRVDIPRRETLTTNGQANGGSHDPSRTGTPLPDNDDEEEPTLPITLTGAAALVQQAQEAIQEIISSRTAWSTQRIKDIPPHILPFILCHRARFLEAADGAEVTLGLNKDIGEITVSGERTAVGRVIETIKSALNFYTKQVTPVKITLPKRQHRLLMGKGADEIMAESRCTVIVQKLEEQGDDVTVWGLAKDLPNGLSAAMAKANSAYIHEFPLPGPIGVSRQLLNYMIQIGYPETIMNANPGASVYTPPQATIDKASVLNVDILGEKPAVDAAVRQVSGLVGKLIGATRDVQIDFLVHPILKAPKYQRKISGFHEVQNVSVYFPSEEKSSVLLVYDPFSPNASPSPVEKAQRLDEVEKELLKLAKEIADVKAEKLQVEKKWHSFVANELDRIIGEEQTLSVKLGADVGDASEDIILVHGICTEVEEAVKKINKIVEDAKEDEILSSYVTEFEIDREHVGRIVGHQGANVNRMRDSLKVKIDFQDDHEERKEEVGKKSKKPPTQKAKVKITGRKENADEAKKRIIMLAEKYADETQEILKIPHRYHASLIGQGGKYVVRLEEKYGVKITFPRDSKEKEDGKTREPLTPDEVLVKGGRKGVAGTKSELLEALEFEKENDNVAEFTIPARSVARVLGKAGASINEIKDNTGAQIDIDKSGGDVAHVTVRGSKAAVADAKAAILAIAEQVHEEIHDSLTIEPQFHRTLIGAGGQGLKDLITRVGGPTDPKLQAGLIRFPRQGEPSDQVHLRGEPKVVEKIKVELEKAVAALRDRVVLGVAIPAVQHRALIGRGGQHLNDLQNRTGAQVQFPGSRSYHGVGDPYNADELADADPADIVKVTGGRSACEKAIEELKASVKPPAPEGVTGTLTVPIKYHHAVTQQGNLFRNLRSFGVQVEQSALPQQPPVPPHPVSSAGVTSARIDDPEDGAVASTYEWQVVPNYQNTEEGDAKWTFKARDQATLDKAIKTVEDAIEHAKSMTHVGFLTLPDRSSFPRIVGSKGANVARLRAESNADITVSREDSTIVIIGSESAIESARDAILKITTQNGHGGGRGRGRRDY